MINKNLFASIILCRKNLLEMRFLKANKQNIPKHKYNLERKKLSKLLTKQRKNFLGKISRG